MSVGFAVSLVRRLFSALCRALPVVLRSFPCRRLPFGVSAFFWPCLPALLLRWWRRLGCRPSLVFSVLLLHRLACRCSLGSAPCDRVLPLWLLLLFVWQCGGALWLPEPLGICWLFCHPLLQFSASVGAELCSLFGFPCLRVGALLACGVCSASLLRSLCSLGCPSWVVLLLLSLFVLHLLLWVRLFGHSLLAPPAAPVC